MAHHDAASPSIRVRATASDLIQAGRKWNNALRTGTVVPPGSLACRPGTFADVHHHRRNEGWDDHPVGLSREHPDIFVTDPKEAQFFGSGNDHNWSRGLGRHQQLFAGSDTAKARGEASPGYTLAPHIPHVPERIASVVPEAKLVYLLRNPVDRIRSAYLDRASRGVEILSLPAALEAKPRYLDASRYAYQLERYLEHFPREQTLAVVGAAPL